nr:hypothetical protein [Tanacetum cinerariifolium]
MVFSSFRYAKSKQNGNLIYNSIMHDPYVRRMIPKLGDPDREVSVAETFLKQTDEECTEKEVKKMEVDDQAIQTILIGLPEDIYAAVDSCETAKEICLRIQQMMKGFDIRIQEKKAKLFNEWERFTSIDGESTDCCYHRFLELMNDFKRNKHFLEKIASNLKFLNNLPLEWSRHVTIVHQTKDLHDVDYTLLYDFLKYNQVENGLSVVPEIANQNGNGNVVEARADGNGNGNGNGNNGNQVTCYNCRGMEEEVKAKEFDLMAAVWGLDKIEEVNANNILMANLQQASTLCNQTDKALVYESDGTTEVHKYDSCYNNEIFNMFTQEEQYTELLESILEPHKVQQNDNNVIYMVYSMEQSRGIVEHPATVEETRAYFESLYNNLAIEVEKYVKLMLI